MDAPGTGPEQFRDRRHPDLKRVKTITPNVEPGAPRRGDKRPKFSRTGGFHNLKMIEMGLPNWVDGK
jgi:hypothetical protein